jgi:hypothetical protein
MAQDEIGSPPSGQEESIQRIRSLSKRVKELEQTASAQEQAIFCLVHYLVDVGHVDYEALRVYVDTHAENLATHPGAASQSARENLSEVANKLRSILPPTPPDDDPSKPQLTIIRGGRPKDEIT